MKKNLLLITLTLLIYSCGYEPIVNNNYKEFTIENIELMEKNFLNNQIKKHLLYYSKPGKEKIYLTIDSKKEIRVFSKDSKGNSSNYEMTVIVDVVLKKNSKNFSKSFSLIGLLVFSLASIFFTVFLAIFEISLSKFLTPDSLV